MFNQQCIILGCMILQLLSQVGGITFNKYHNYEEMKLAMQSFTKVYSNMTDLYSIGKSVLGKDILVVNISTAKPDQLRVPNVKIVGSIHGDEPIGREVILHLMEHLVHEYIRGERTIRFLLDNTRIHLLPNMNPDGADLAVEGNCRSGRGRNNINNHDLNRQFPDYFRFNRSGLPYILSTSHNMDPEVQAVIDWMHETQFVLSLQLHGGHLVASYPYDSNFGESLNERLIRLYGTADAEKISKIKTKGHRNEPALTPDTDVFEHLAKTYAQKHTTMTSKKPCPGNGLIEFENGVINGAAWFAFSGGMADYNYLFHGCLEITLEISCCRYPSSREIYSHWRQNQDALISWLKQVHRGVKGFVLDENGEPLANVTLNIKHRNVTFKSTKYGEYWRVLLPGSYEIEASKEGYVLSSEKIDIPSTDNEETVYETILEFNITLSPISNAVVSEPNNVLHDASTNTNKVLTHSNILLVDSINNTNITENPVTTEEIMSVTITEEMMSTTTTEEITSTETTEKVEKLSIEVKEEQNSTLNEVGIVA